MVCAKCNKSENLKKCAKCHTEEYCSRECQKAHWKVHKKVCASHSNARTSGNQSTSSDTGSTKPIKSPLDVHVQKPFNKLDAKTWLHDRSKEDVYKLLVDSCRLRLEDEYKFEQTNTEGSVFAGESNSLVAFKSILRLAESKHGLLPPWWSDNAKEACIAVGMDKPDDWYYLGFGPEKADFIEHYGDPHMPMQMRMFAEQVNGRGLMGQDGTPMRQMMMERENGTSKFNAFFSASLAI